MQGALFDLISINRHQFLFMYVYTPPPPPASPLMMKSADETYPSSTALAGSRVSSRSSGLHSEGWGWIEETETQGINKTGECMLDIEIKHVSYDLYSSTVFVS